MRLRPVKPRATRIALMVASVPEDTRRTDSIEGTAWTSASASFSSPAVGAPNDSPLRAARSTAASTIGSAWPRIAGPQEPM